MTNLIILAALVLLPKFAIAQSTLYIWEIDNRDWVSCFRTMDTQHGLRGFGNSVSDSLCGLALTPIRYIWGQPSNGRVSCYALFRRNDRMLNHGQPVDERFCALSYPDRYNPQRISHRVDDQSIDRPAIMNSVIDDSERGTNGKHNLPSRPSRSTVSGNHASEA